MWLVLLLLAAYQTDHRQLLQQARAGNRDAQVEAARLSRNGALPALSLKQASLWIAENARIKHPAACLEHARSLTDSLKRIEPFLRCAVAGGLPEAQYLLGRLILNRTAAEDEQPRFEGLAYLALSAKSGYAPALRRWDFLLDGLTPEDLERVQQKADELAATR